MKLYADEFGSESIRSIDVIVVSSLSRVEVPAALWRKHRMGELDATDTSVLVRAFESDYFGGPRGRSRFAILPITDEILDEAARSVAAHALRAYDAMQLSSAVAARGADPECMSFACFDEGLRAAAGAEGFTLIG